MHDIQDAVPARLGAPKCSQCGSTRFQDGFVHQEGQGAGRAYWYSGPWTDSVWAGVRGKSRRRKGTVVAYRCEECGHLEFFSALEDPR